MRSTDNISAFRLFIVAIVLTGFMWGTSSCKSKKATSKLPGKEFVVTSNYSGSDVSRMLERALAEGAEVIRFEKGRFKLSKPLDIDGRNVAIIGESQNHTVLTADGNSLIRVKAEAMLSMPYMNSVKEGSQHLNIFQSDGWKKEGIIQLSAPHGMPEQTSGGYTSHYTGRITSVDRNRIELDRPVEIPFREHITLSWYPSTTFSLKSLTLEADNTLYMVEIRNCDGVQVENVKFVTPRKRYMGEYREANPQIGVSALGIFASQDIVVSNCEFEYIWYGLMAHEGCYNVQIVNARAYRSRHVNNNGVGTDNFTVKNCLAVECEGGFDSHPTALGTRFINCVDSLPKEPSKFRGRRDEIINCRFGHGIELSVDKGISHLFGDSTIIRKTVKNTEFYGEKTLISGGNILFYNCRMYAPIVPDLIAGTLTIRNCEIDLHEYKGGHSAALTLGDASPDGQSCKHHIENVRITGPGPNATNLSIGVYLPMRNSGTIALEDVRVDNFEKGLVLYGGPESASRYQQLYVNDMRIENCTYGIFQQEFTKDVKRWDITITSCRYETNIPGLIREMKETNK